MAAGKLTIQAWREEQERAVEREAERERQQRQLEQLGRDIKTLLTPTRRRYRHVGWCEKLVRLLVG
jgi:hypothetical protein